MTNPCSRTEALRRGAVLSVDQYDVNLDFVSEPTYVVSETTIRFESRTPASPTFAQLAAGGVNRVELNGRRLDPAAVVADDRVTLDELSAENELVVESFHSYGDDGRAFARTLAEDGSGYVLAYAYPTSASGIFCCFDQPDLPARMHLSVDAPAGWECVTNSRARSRPPEGESGTWQFETSVQKPQELILALGPYRMATDPAGGDAEPRVLCRPALVADVDVGRLGHLVRSALDFYAELFGVASPSDWLDVAFIPGLPPLAVCVPGLVGLHEDLARRIADPDDDFATMVIGHELAHLWFGCLVDCRWWDDLWLAEALATWASFVAGERRLGMREPWAEFAMTEKERAYAADELPTTEPVASAVESADSATARSSALTYGKGAALVRQLEAVIGEDAVREGLRRYFERFSGGTATLEDVVACWSEAAGRDLSAWAAEWLESSGVNLLRPDLTVDPDGRIQSLDIVQEPSRVRDAAPILRRHSLRIGLYDAGGEGLRRRRALDVEVAGRRTHVSQVAGSPAPLVLTLNDGDLGYSRIRFDGASLASLVERDVELADPVTEAVCWTALWDMTRSAELSARQFVEAVARRIERPGLPPGPESLGANAVEAANRYSVPSLRPKLRERLASACAGHLASETTGSRAWRRLALVFAKASETGAQLDTVERWLVGGTLREVWALDIARAALATLAATGRLTDTLLEEVTTLDRASGTETRARCRAIRPDRAAKQKAWDDALRPEVAPRLARAHAEGFWVPGQEPIVAAWRERYFTEALPALGAMSDDRARRVGAALYPLTLADDDTVSATDEALRAGGVTRPVRSVLEEQRAIILRIRAARTRSAANEPLGSGPMPDGRRRE